MYKVTRGNSVFAWLPVESIIHDRQQEYYEMANNMSTDEIRRQQINQFLYEHDVITNANVRELLQVSPATANRILARFTERGLIRKIRLGKQWAYCYT